MNINMIALIKQFVFLNHAFLCGSHSYISRTHNEIVQLLYNITMMLYSFPGVFPVSHKIHTVYIFEKSSLFTALSSQRKIVHHCHQAYSIFQASCRTYSSMREHHGPLALRESPQCVVKRVVCHHGAQVECWVLTVVTISRVWRKKISQLRLTGVHFTCSNQKQHYWLVVLTALNHLNPNDRCVALAVGPCKIWLSKLHCAPPPGMKCVDS